MKSGTRPKASRKAAIWAVISDLSATGSRRCITARANVAASDRNLPSRVGVKVPLSGKYGAVSVRWSPIATRRATELSASSANASKRPKLGAATITEVALMRPRTTRSRMATSTAGEMP